MHKTVLTVVYDLDVSPASYDFLIFLMHAEQYRVRNQYPAMIIMFMPGSDNGFRKDGMVTQLNERKQMLNQVLIPACKLLSSVVGVISPPYRVGVADEDVFPVNYHVDKCKKLAYLNYGILQEMALGQDPVNWEIPQYAQDIVKELDDGRQIVTINLRENPDYPSRNSNLQAWDRFVHRLDKSKYRPVVVRETNYIGQPLEGFRDALRFDAASVDLMTRAALYKIAACNMFVPCGTAMLSLFQNTRTCMLKVIDENVRSTSAKWAKDKCAMSPKFPSPPFCTQNHRYYWVNDTTENITDAFSDCINRPLTADLHDFNEQDFIQAVLNSLSHDIQYGITDDLRAIIHMLCVVPGVELGDALNV